MKETHKQIGALIRDYRIKIDMTQLQLAEKLGYDSPQFVSLFERGLSKIPYETLGRLVIILGIPERKVTNILLDAYEQELTKKINSGKKSGLKAV